jgi:oxaloacetate decarboxylase gamma subunit
MQATLQSHLLQQGVELMLYGMGTVFLFLFCLVLLTSAMSALLARLVPLEEIPAAMPPATPPRDDRLVAAIGAAVHKYRSRHKP